MESIHSCTQQGKKGCVHGSIAQTKEYNLKLAADLKAEILGETINVYHNAWNNKSTQLYNISPFTQSLTWGEKIK